MNTCLSHAGKIFAVTLLLSSVSGCSSLNVGGIGIGNAVGSATDLYKAATLGDAEIKTMALEAAAESDRSNKVLSSGPYVARLSKIAGQLKSYDSLQLNFKVYQTKDINAFALANGSVRVYSGLMDLMTDDELFFVLGHEAGHVKLGHSKHQVQLAYSASAVRKGVAASGTVAGALAASEIGAFTEDLVNAQFSQSEETESDEYGLAALKKFGRPKTAGPAALRKLAKLGGDHSFLSSHPDPEDRAANLESLK